MYSTITSPMRKAERIGVVQPREVSRESVLQPFHIQRGLARKMEKDFLPRPVLTRQGAMVLNRKRGNLD